MQQLLLLQPHLPYAALLLPQLHLQPLQLLELCKLRLSQHNLLLLLVLLLLLLLLLRVLLLSVKVRQKRMAGWHQQWQHCCGCLSCCWYCALGTQQQPI